MTPSLPSVLKRWALPALMLGIMFSFLGGIVSGARSFRPGKMAERAEFLVFQEGGERVPSDFGPWGDYITQASDWWESHFHHAGPCRDGAYSSEFQTRQCAKFESQDLKAFLPLLFPVLGILILFSYALGSTKRLHRKIEKVTKETTHFRGKKPPLHWKKVAVLRPKRPMKAEADGFAYLYHLKRVLLPEVKEKVYLPLNVEAPLPGQGMILIPLGNYGGNLRYLGVVDHPQMATLSST